MNKVILIGNLTRDPETKQSGDMTICKFSIAVNRRFNKEEVDFLNIVTFKALAENCNKFLSKGKKVAVSGRIQTGSYENNEGKRVYTTDIIADEVQFLTTRNEDASGSAPAELPRKPETPQQTIVDERCKVVDEELPF